MALLGKVFAPGSGAGIVCEVTLKGTVLVAAERAGERRVFNFALTEASVTFAGDADSQVKVVADDHIFYGERQFFEAPLAELGLAQLKRTLQVERAQAKTRRRWEHVGLLAFVLLCVVGVAAFVWFSDRAVEWAVTMTSPALEQSISEPLLGSFAPQAVTDPAIIRPVEQILGRLVEAAGEQPYTFRLKVVKDDAVNAFALPGGGVVVLTGLLQKADNPEEVAGVLAHEIQHVLGRHSLRTLYQQLKWQLAVSMLVGSDEGMKQLLVTQGASMVQLSYGREMETESDVLGAALLVKAGLSPRGLRDFFVHLKEEEGKAPQPMEFLSTHPATSHRIEALERLAREAGDQPSRPLDVDWQGLKQALESQPKEGGKS